MPKSPACLKFEKGTLALRHNVTALDVNHLFGTGVQLTFNHHNAVESTFGKKST